MGEGQIFLTARRHSGHISVPNNGTAAMLVNQINHVWIDLFFLLFKEICIAANNVSGNDLYLVIWK